MKSFHIMVYLCADYEDINECKKRLEFLPHKVEQGVCYDGFTPLYAVVNAASHIEATSQLVVDLASKHIRPDRIIIK